MPRHNEGLEELFEFNDCIHPSFVGVRHFTESVVAVIDKNNGLSIDSHLDDVSSLSFIYLTCTKCGETVSLTGKELSGMEERYEIAKEKTKQTR